MAYNVFGNPITDETLKGMAEYADKHIGRSDRAYVALNMKNAAEKGFNARTHVEKLKEQYGDGVSTLCLVYNATGDTIRYVYKKDWYGHIGKAPYPPLIANGQWGAFLHVKTAGGSYGSNAAVVYRGLNIVSEECDWMLSWSNPWNRAESDNTVYTEVRKAGHFDTAWDEISNNLDKVQENIKHTSNGSVSIMSTGNGTSPIVEAILALDHAFNVFGNPITDETLKGMPEYVGKEITRLDRARVALSMKDVGEKSINARTFVENLEEEYGLGISTLLIVYNATGAMIKFHAENDWYGHIGKAPYPPVILNGQWGAFLHVETAGESSGSNAAVVYRGLNNVGDECDWMLSWRNRDLPNQITFQTEVRRAGHFDTAWDEIYKNYLGYVYLWDISNGCASIMSFTTGNGTSLIVEAILTLEEMAYNVFGKPITDETLKGMPEYDGKEITRLDRARVALSMKDVGEKSHNARTYVENLKKEYGLGISTLCLVYNATGDMIKFHAKNDWYGHIGKAPYPPVILNGQWGAFLHVKTAVLPLAGSNAAVVYRGLNNAGSECDWMLSWSNPLNSEGYKNTVYTEVLKAGHFDTAWDEISKAFERVHENIKHTSNGCVSIMATGNDTSPIVEAILTLEHAEEAKPTTGHAQVSPTVGAIPTSEHA